VDAALKSSTPATVTMPFTALSISGNVYDDANGLTDNTVNGTGTNAGNKIYAQLINSSGTAIANTAVASNGTYTFSGLNEGTYTVLIDSMSTLSTSTLLPVGWVNTGENIGTGPGSDGNVNGISASINLTANTTNVNFGIDQLPTANAVTAVPQPNPGGTNTVVVPTLTGSDPENGSFTGVSNTNTIIIETLPSNGILYYNGVAIPVGDTINNYNPSLLTVDPNNGVLTISFDFAEVDSAGGISLAALVSMPFTVPLPVTIVDFSAKLNNSNAVNLKWDVTNEVNTMYYEVERSTDGITFNPISEINATGTNDGLTSYQATDVSPANGINYYRLKVVDNNGAVEYSEIISITTNNINVSNLTVMPNPFISEIDAYLELTDAAKVNICIIDMSGRQVYKNEVSGNAGINWIHIDGLQNLASGMYIINFITDHGMIQKKLIKE
jgi:hypothetical protein